METALVIFSGILTLGGILSSIALIRYLEAKSRNYEIDTRIKGQNEIFDWALKIVSTVEEEYRKSDLEKKLKSQRKFDQAISRLNDVMMINGIDPKYYNASGIITYSIYLLRTNGS